MAGTQVICYLCTAEQSMWVDDYVIKKENKRIYAVAIAHGPDKKSASSSDRYHKIYVPVFNDSNKESRDDALIKVWNAFKQAGQRGQIVLLQCGTQGVVRSPILLAALLIWCGYSKDAALGFISRSRCIHAGHVIRDLASWKNKDQSLLSQLSEAHEWLSRLATTESTENDGSVPYLRENASKTKKYSNPLHQPEGNASVPKRASKVTLTNPPAEKDPPGTASSVVAMMPHTPTSTHSAVEIKSSSESSGKRGMPSAQQDPPDNKSMRLSTTHTDHFTQPAIHRTFNTFAAEHAGVTSSLFDCSMDGLQTAGGQLVGFLSDEETLMAVTLSELRQTSEICSRTRIPEVFLNRIVRPEEVLPCMNSWSLLNTDRSEACYSLFAWTDKRVIWLASTPDGLILRSVLRSAPVVGTFFRCAIVDC